MWGVIEDNQSANINNANAELAIIKDYIDSKYEDGGISFNYCTELIVNQDLYDDPASFLSCTSMHESGWLNLLINFNPNVNGTGRACDIGSTCGWSVPDGTAVHELGHMLNLYHTFESDQCIGDIPADHNSGGNLSDPMTGDRVADTPVHKNINDHGNLPRGNGTPCLIDWANSYCDFTTDQNGMIIPTTYYPADYCRETPNGPQLRILEDNVMSYMYGCAWDWVDGNYVSVGEKFTTGQFERMNAYINSDLGPYQGSNTPCNASNSPQILNNALVTGGANLTGIYVVSEDININSQVTITDAIIRVNGSYAITVNSSGSLTCNNVRFIKGCSSAGGQDGIITEIGSTLSLEETSIENFNIGLRLNTKNVNLSVVKFFNCTLSGMVINNLDQVGPITTKDVYFHSSPVIINNSRVMLLGSKFYNSNLTVNQGSLWIDQQMAASRPAFYDSAIDFTGSFFGVNYGYFNNGSLINVGSSTLTQICWSYLDHGEDRPKIQLGFVDNYNILGNIFGLGGNYINAGVESENSFVNNNIFGAGTSDFHSNDTDVEISCNYHDDSAEPYDTPSGFKDQGVLDHPAGNIFNTTIDDDVVAASPFDYRYDEDNLTVERPKLSNPMSLFRTGIDAKRDKCKSREVIWSTGLWEEFDPLSDCFIFFRDENFTDPVKICGDPVPPPPPPVFPILEDTECITCPDCVGCPDCVTCPECPGCFDHDEREPEGRSINTSDNLVSSISNNFQNHDTNGGDIVEINVIDDELIFRSNEVLDNYTANLYNVSGKKIGIYELNGAQNSFDFNAIPEGIYFIVLLDDMGRLIKNQVIFQTK